MPVSSSVQISDCLEHILLFEPTSVLDIGCGFGLWGFLCREYLDVWNERVQPADWQIRIDGVELWEPYLQPHQRHLYDKLYVGDVRELVSSLGAYDLIIAGDIIEHLDKQDALEVVAQLHARATKALIVNIPLTGNWDHPIQHGNPGELHRSQWTASDFDAYPAIFKEYKLPCGEYGSFCFVKEALIDPYVDSALDIAEKRSTRGDHDGALRAVRDAHALLPEDPSVILAMTELYLRAQRPAEAVAVLRRALAVSPDFHYARLSLVRLLRMQRDHARADQELQHLLAAPGIPEEIRMQSEGLLTPMPLPVG